MGLSDRNAGMAVYDVKRSVWISQEMHELLRQHISKRGRKVNESEVIREAIRHYLDDQNDVVGSQRHFQRSMQARLDQMEFALAFHLNVVVYLLASWSPEDRQRFLEDAIIAAKREGKTLLVQMAAVRDMR